MREKAYSNKAKVRIYKVREKTYSNMEIFHGLFKADNRLVKSYNRLSSTKKWKVFNTRL